MSQSEDAATSASLVATLKLASKQNAAAYPGVSFCVMSTGARIAMGGRFMGEHEELDRWIERQKNDQSPSEAVVQ